MAAAYVNPAYSTGTIVYEDPFTMETATLTAGIDAFTTVAAALAAAPWADLIYITGGNLGGDNCANGTAVTVNDSAGGTIYGGGSAALTADTSIELKGGSIAYLYGGGYGAGGTLTGNTRLTVSGGNVTGGIYGGGSGGTVTGNVAVKVTGGTVATIVGGGSGSSSAVYGNVAIKVAGGTVTAIYGGGSVGAVSGKIDIEVTDGTVGTIYGGGVTGDVTGDINITISGGTAGTIYGGGNRNSGTGATTVTGDIHITIEAGGSVTGDVYGGGVRTYGSMVVDGDITITIAGSVDGHVYGGGNYYYNNTVTGNGHIILIGATVGGTVFADVSSGTYAAGATKAVTVSGGLVSTVGGLANATELTVELGSSLVSTAAMTNSGVLNLAAANGVSITAAATFTNSGSIVVDASGYEMADGVYRVKLIDAAAWSGDATSFTLINYAGARNLVLTVNDNDLCLVDIDTRIAYVNTAYTMTETPETYEDPFSLETVRLSYDANAFTSVTAAAIRHSNVSMIYVTGGNLGTSYAAGVAVTVNDSTGGSLVGGATTALTADTKITVRGGAVAGIYGGGNGSGAALTGKIDIEITGGTVTNLYGGGINSAVTGSIDIEVSGGTVTNLYGGGSNGDVNGDINITVSGGTVGTIYGGSRRSATGTSTVYGDINITVEAGGAVTGNVYGGGDRSNGTSNVDGDAYIMIAGRVDGYVYGGGYISNVTGNSHITLAGATVAGNVSAAYNVTGAAKTVTVSGGLASTVGGLSGATELTVELGSSLTSTAAMTNSGVLNLAAANGLSITVATTFTNSGSIVVDASGYEMADGVYRVKLIDAVTWSGGTTGFSLVNYEGSRNLMLLVNNHDLYLVDAGSGNIYVNSTYSTAATPETYEDPFSLETTQISYNANAFNSMAAGAAARSDISMIYVTGGALGTSYASGVAVTVNDSTGGTLYGGSGNSAITGDINIAVKGGTVTNVYGGGYGSGSVTGDIDIKVTGGKITSVSGGGSNGGGVSGDIGITVSDGTITTVYGSGFDATVDGKVDIKVIGGTVSTVYGAGYRGGVTGDTVVTISGGTVNAVYGGGTGIDATVGGNTSITVSGGSVTGTLYGGGISGAIYGSVDIKVTGGTVAMIIGGGNSGGVAGDINITISGGTVGTLYGGSSGGTATVGGSVNITIEAGAAVTGNVFGGGYMSASGYSVVAGDVMITIAGSVGNHVYAGGANGSSTVTGNSHIRLIGATVGGTVYAAYNVTGAAKTVTVSGGLASTVGGFTGATELTVELGSTLTSTAAMTNSGALNLSAANGISITVATTFTNSGSIVVDASGFEMEDGVYRVKLIDASTWSGNTANFTLVNYEGSRNLVLAVNDNDLYLVDADTSAAYVNAAYTMTGTPETYEDPFSLATVQLSYSINAFSAMAAATANSGISMIYVTGGNLGTSYADGIAVTVNGGTVTALYGGGSTALEANVKMTVRGGTVTDLYGGGAGTSALTGNIDIKVTGGTVTALYGGGSNSDVNGDINITISGGTVGAIYGGSRRSAAGASTVSGDIHITIEAGGTVTGSIYGGGYRSNGTSTVDGDVTITIEGRVSGNVYGGGYISDVTGNSHITLAGATVAGTVTAAYNVTGAAKTVTVSGGLASTVGGLTGATELTVELGSSLTSTAAMTNSGVLNLSAANGISITVATTFTNSGSIVVDASGFELEDGVYRVKLVDASTWSGDNTSFTLINYAGARNLMLVVNDNDLYLVDADTSVLYVNTAYTMTGTPETYEDPFSLATVQLSYSINAFSAMAAATAKSGVSMICVTGGNLGTSYADGIAVTVNNCASGSLYGGGNTGTVSGDIALTVKGGTIESLYGGGNSGAVDGDIGIEVTGGTVSTLYGGGYAGAVTGNTNVTISGGNVTSGVYGGGYSGTIGGNTNVTISGGSVTGTVYGGGRSAGGTIGGSANVTISGGNVAAVFGGGGSGSAIGGDVHITISGGRVTTLYGGSNGGTVTGDIHIEVTSGDVTNFYGGGSGGAVGGDVHITISGGTVGTLYGGIYTSGATTLDGSVNITIEAGGAVTGSIYGGGYLYSGSTKVTGDVAISIAGSVGGSVYGGGGYNSTVTGNSHITLAGATVGGSVLIGHYVNGTEKTVTVSGGLASTVGGLSGATELTVELGSTLASTAAMTNSGVLNLAAANGLSITVATTFTNSGSIVIDASGYEMADGVYKVKLIDAVTWSGDTTSFTLANYAGARNLMLVVNENDLYLVDVDGDAVYVNSNYTANGTPDQYTDPFTGRTMNLAFDANAFSTMAAATAKSGGVPMIYVTGGSLGTSYANGIAVTVNGGTVTTLAGGGSSGSAISGNASLTVKGGTVTNLYGGGYAGTLTGNVDITVSGGTVTTLVGGGYSANVDGDINITISGGAVGTIYGGSYQYNNGASTVTGDVNIVIAAGVTVTGSVYGGGYLYNGASSTVAGDVTITIAGKVNNSVYGGGYNNSCSVTGNSHITLTGATVAGTVNPGYSVTGAAKTVTVSGGLASTVGGLTGATELTVELGSSLTSTAAMTNSGVLNLSAANGISITVTTTFTNSGSIVVDASGYEMADDVYRVKLVDATTWSGDTTSFTLINYAGARNLMLVVNDNDLYLVDADTSVLYVNTAYTMTGTPETYEDPFSLATVQLSYSINAFSAMAAATAKSGVSMIYVTGGNLGTSYANGCAVTVNNCAAGSSLYGGGYTGDITGDIALTVKGGTLSYLYAGGNGSAVTGNANLTVSGGTVSNLYGGGNAGAFTGDTGIEVTGGTVGSLYGGGTGSTFTGNTSLTVSGGNISNLYGGGYNTTVIGNTAITVSGGTVSNLYGGGINTTVDGKVDIEITDGKVTTLYGGGSSGAVTGDINIEITGGTVGTVYGAGATCTVGGGVNITISGGTVGTLYGGSYTRGATTLNGSVNITIEAGGAVTGSIYGGGYLYSGSTKVAGDVAISIAGSVGGNVYGGGGYYGTVTGNSHITLAGATVGGTVNAGSNVAGAEKTVTVSGGLASTVGGLTGATELTVELGSTLTSTAAMTNSGVLNLSAANGLSITVATTFTNSGSIVVDASGFELEDGVHKIKLIDAAAWSGNTANFTLINYAGTRNLMLVVNSNDLYLVDVAQEAIYVNSTYTANGTPAQYTDPFTGSVVNLAFNANAFAQMSAGQAVNPDALMICVTGGALGTSYANGFAVTVNDSTGGTLYGGGSAAMTADTQITVKGGKITYVYGGGSAKLTGNTGITVSGGDNSYIYGGGYNSNVTGDTGVTVSGGKIIYVYGGGYGSNGTVTGNTAVTVSGGNVTSLYGGGHSNAAVGSADIRVTGGTVGNVFGGGYNSNVAGDINITISGGTVGTLYGGGYNSNVTGDINITISGGTVGNVYGGNYTSGAITAVGGAINIAIEAGGNVTGSVYGSGYRWSGSAAVAGDVAITIAGRVGGSVFGDYHSAVTGNCHITLMGGTVAGTVNVSSYINGAEKTVTVTGGTLSTVGTISGATATTVENGASLLVTGNWGNTGTLDLYAADSTVITVNGRFSNTRLITVNAEEYAMGEGLDSVRLIAAASFTADGNYVFQNGTRFHTTGEGDRYALVANATGLWIMEQSLIAYVNSQWNGAYGALVYDGEDGAGYFDINAFNTIGAATASAFEMIYVKGGSYAGGEFRGVAAVIQSGEEVGAATRFTGNVYGGASSGSLAESTSLAVNGGDFGKKNVYGGNVIATESALSFNSSLTIDGGGNFGLIVGGNHITASGALFTQSSLYVGLAAGDSATAVFGGNAVASAGALALTGDSVARVDGGTFSNFVVGGDYITSGSVIRTGNATLEISAGTFNNIVVGGLLYRGADTGTLTGDVVLTITGGTFSKYIYAGNAASDLTVSARTALNGNTYLTLDSSNSAIHIGANNVYAGSYGAGTITGNTNVTITGSGANLNFTGILSGVSQAASASGGRHDFANYVTYVDGRANLTFDGFSGNFNAAATCFHTVNLTGDSEVTFTAAQTHLAAADSWNFELGSSLNWEAGSNDFSGDVLTFAFDASGWNDESAGWEVITGSASALTGWDYAGNLVSIAGAAAAWSDDISGWTTGDFSLTFDDRDGRSALIISKIA